MKIEFIEPEKIKWAYCQSSDIPSPVVPGKIPHTWECALHWVKVNGWPLHRTSDYSTALESHKELGYGEVINTPETSLGYDDIATTKPWRWDQHGYRYYEKEYKDQLIFVPAPPIGTYDLND